MSLSDDVGRRPTVDLDAWIRRSGYRRLTPLSWEDDDWRLVLAADDGGWSARAEFRDMWQERVWFEHRDDLHRWVVLRHLPGVRVAAGLPPLPASGPVDTLTVIEAHDTLEALWDAGRLEIGGLRESARSTLALFSRVTHATTAEVVRAGLRIDGAPYFAA